MIIFLQAKCSNCPDDDYEWSMEPDSESEKKSIDFNTDTVYGKNNARLIIKEGVLIPGDNYTFTVKYKGKVFSFSCYKR